MLNKLKWEKFVPSESDESELDYAILTVTDRVAPSKQINGSDIVRLGHREFDVKGEDDRITTIPYYKITKVVLGDELIWKRPIEQSFFSKWEKVIKET